MQSSNSVRGYSEFFASGFRAVTTRGSPSSRTSHETSSPQDGRRTLIDMTQRRSRPASMIVHNTISKPPSREKSRRSSFVSFSSRLFDRMISSSNDEKSTASSSSRSKRSSRMFVPSDDSVHEVWITAGGPFTPSAPNGSAAPRPIDPFTSSPDARSMFIDLSSESSGPSPIGTPKREQSFLSLTGSASSRSSLIFTRRERPTSIHTMPLPSRSRRSSFQYRPPMQEKSDFFRIAEEEPASFVAEPILELSDQWDAPSKIDWHQFHIDILTDEPTQ